MKPKSRLILYTFIGSSLGSYIPYIWGEINIISFSGLTLSALGGFTGIYFAYKQNRSTNNPQASYHPDEEEV